MVLSLKIWGTKLILIRINERVIIIYIKNVKIDYLSLKILY